MYMLPIRDTSHIVKYTHTLKMKGWKETVHASGKEKQASVAVLVPYKIVFNTKTINKRDEGEHRIHILFIST